PAAVEPEAVRGTAPDGDRAECETTVVAAEIVRAGAKAQRDTAEIVRPRDRQPRAHRAVAARRLAGRVVELQGDRAAPHKRALLPVVQHVVVVTAPPRVEHQAFGLPRRGELDAFDYWLTRSPGVDRIAISDLHRHAAVALALDGHGRAPATLGKVVALHALQPLVEERGTGAP